MKVASGYSHKSQVVDVVLIAADICTVCDKFLYVVADVTHAKIYESSGCLKKHSGH